MKNTYWFAVDYNGTGHLFIYKPERDTGMWTGEESLYIPQGALKEMFPGITWQDAPIAVTLEVLPCEETFRLRLSKICSYFLKKYLRLPGKERRNSHKCPNMEYRRYEIVIKETGREKPVVTEYHGFIDRKGLVNFYGLDRPDVEWYDIKEII